MPDIITHYCLAENVFQRLPDKLRSSLCRKVYDHTAAGPDVWFSYRFWNGKQKQDKHLRGGQMHREKTGEFLLALAERCRISHDRQMLFSYLAGYLCHYAMDKTAHPYIVYRTGQYDGTQETRKYRGNHTLLERAIDHRYRKAWGKSMWSAPITGRILRMKRIPESIADDLDAVYAAVYGWENVTKDLDIAVWDQKFFYFLVQDPTGVLNQIVKYADNGISEQEYFSLSYAGRDQGELDILNDKKREWQHPCDPAIRSDESFAELFSRASILAEKLILSAESYISGENGSFPQFLGSDSYETGLPWTDVRNNAVKQYAPLPLRGGRKKKE